MAHFSGCSILAVLIFPHLKLHLVLTIFPTRIDLNYFSHFLLKHRYLSTHQFDFSQQISFLLPVFFSSIISGFFSLNLSLSWSSSPFSRIKRAWWFDRMGPGNLLPPSRPFQSLLPHWTVICPISGLFPWQLRARLRVSEKTEISSGSSNLSPTAVY